MGLSRHRTSPTGGVLTHMNTSARGAILTSPHPSGLKGVGVPDAEARKPSSLQNAVQRKSGECAAETHKLWQLGCIPPHKYSENGPFMGAIRSAICSLTWLLRPCGGSKSILLSSRDLSLEQPVLEFWHYPKMQQTRHPCQSAQHGLSVTALARRLDVSVEVALTWREFQSLKQEWHSQACGEGAKGGEKTVPQLPVHISHTGSPRCAQIRSQVGLLQNHWWTEPDVAREVKRSRCLIRCCI